MSTNEKYEKKQFVNKLNVKDRVEDIFLIKNIALMEGRDGRSYLNLTLSDASGDIEGKVWQNAEDFSSRFKNGDFAQVQGKINQYLGRVQLIVQQLEGVSPDNLDEEQFVAKSDKNAEEMFQKLRDIVESLNDVYIRDLLRGVLSDSDISRRLKTWPAGKTIHHAYRSGLLEHILSCVDLSLMLSKHYEVNVNYVVAGAILHDLAKIYELSGDVNVEYTEEGKLVGHLVKGVELVDRFSHRIKNFPYNTKMHLKHILLSHHGEYAYGSPKLPQTSEAYLVHLIDFMDSKMNSLEMVKKLDNMTGPWSGYVKHLDRTVYKNPLPLFEEYLPDRENKIAPSPEKPVGERKKKRHDQGPQELKQSMAGLLGSIKVKD